MWGVLAVKPFDNLVEMLRQELIELALEKGSLGNEELIQKSQELDEFLNSFYTPAHNRMQGFSPHHAARTIEETVTAALGKKGLTNKGHLLRLRRLCRDMGEKLKLSPTQLDNLDLLALMHNLGMLVIPRRILLKKEPLTEKELHLIRQHPEKGYRFTLALGRPSTIADLILKHNEHWDGGGFPQGLKGKEIPLECRIFAIVVTYCALTSNRLYRRAWHKNKARAELKRCAGSQFDPELVKVFCGLVSHEPEI